MMTTHGHRRHVAAFWTDNANITRSRIVPAKRFQASGFAISLTNGIQSMPAMWDSPFESPVGEVYLTPDDHPTTTTHDIANWMDDTVAFFGDMRLDNGAHAWQHCPRTFLRHQLQQLHDTYGLTPTVGFEMEFQLLDRATQTPVDSALYCSMKAFHDATSWRVLKRIVETLEDALGIPVHQYHAESASGQLEISIGTFGMSSTSDPVGAIVQGVDKLVLARQTVYAVAAQAGLQATFVPKLRPNEAGNAAHMHIGLKDVSSASSNLFATDVTRATSFLAGILAELPSMCMLLAPTINSYDRLQPKCWAGAYQCYGYENREAPIRLVGPTTAREDLTRVNHFEIKTVDGTANPYLALGAILAAGMSGLDRALVLPPALAQDPSTLDEDVRPALLPRSLGDAIDRFQERATALWSNVLSPTYAELLVTLRRAELAYYGSLEKRDDRVKQLLKRY